ncbi:MAG: Asp23/Gls24 family envelope stress response protein [Anaerolineales bacterium]|nr:Asp23/Gls24 family envelope stress response protein [Anaerolineales bacterium]
MDAQPSTGRITVAHDVLETIVRLTTLAVPGVARLTPAPGVARLFGQDGVKIEVTGNNVRAEVYVVAEPSSNLLRIGRQIQADVIRAIQDMVGMEVDSVDVYIEDVAYPARQKG